MNAQVFYGYKCPKCGSTVDVNASVMVGGSPRSKPACPSCGADMEPNLAAKGTTLNAHCRKCNSVFGVISSNVCPTCGEPFAT
jgi:rRNA maturation endonuclease Nob1